MRNKIDSALSWVLIVFMSLMVINVLWQVFSRFVLQMPSTFTDEFSTFLLIWVGLLGAAFATGKGSHLAIDILPNKLEGNKKALLNKVISVFVVIFALTVMVIGGGRLVYLTLLLKQLSPTLQVPLGIIYSVVPLSGMLIIYYTLHNLIYTKDGAS